MNALTPIAIHLISDSTGDTAARVARAVQTQFAGHPTALVRHPRVATLDGLSDVLERIEPASSVIYYTLVDRELRRTLSEHCAREGIASCDLLGPPLEALAAAAGHEADFEPGRPIGLDPDYFRRWRPWSSRCGHDDGLASEGLHEAEIVLIGVSRTGKTPLSMYLGYMGRKAANVPLVRGHPAAPRAVRDRPAHDRRPDHRRRAPGRVSAAGACGPWPGGRAHATATPSSNSVTRSSTRRPPSSAGWAVRPST